MERGRDVKTSQKITSPPLQASPSLRFSAYVTPTAVKKDKNACGAFVGRIFAHILTHSGSSGSNTVCVQVTLSAPMLSNGYNTSFESIFYNCRIC
nr:MAG TPA: hypothetical protein [Inoviridae sp.]